MAPKKATAASKEEEKKTVEDPKKRKADEKAEEAAPKKEAKKEEASKVKKEDADSAEKEKNAPTDKRAALKETIGFNPADSTLNVVPSAGGKLLMAMTEGGMQYLIAGARANVGVKAGRYMYEVRIVEALNPAESSGAARGRVPMPRQLVRLGFSVAGSQPVMSDTTDSVYFDSEGCFVAGKGKKPAASQRFTRDQVIAVVLNLDPKSANANTISLFREGERISEPQPVPENLIGKPLFPHVAFRSVTVQMLFGPTPSKPLPFTCRMLQSAAQADVVVSPGPKADSKFDVMLPVGLPDEGTFDWLDSFLEKNPQYVELSDRKIQEWAASSGLAKPKSAGPLTSNDKPQFNFGLPGMDDGSVRRVINAIAPLVPRHYVVMEVKSNLVAAERQEMLRRFGLPHFNKVAHVVMGEPSEDYKAKQLEKKLKEKQEKANAEWKLKKAEEERKKQVEQRQKQLAEMRKKADEARKKAAEESKKKREEEQKKKEAEKKAKEDAEKKAKEEEGKEGEDANEEASEAKAEESKAAEGAMDVDESKEEVKKEEEETKEEVKEEDKKDEEMEEKQEEGPPQVELTEEEQQMWGPFAHVFALALAVSLVSFQLQFLNAAVLDETSWASTVSSLLDLTWQLMICLIFSAFPRRVTPRAMNLTYVSLSAWWIVETLVLSDAGTFTIFFPAIYAERAVWGLVICNGWTTTVCNVVITVCQVSARWWHLSSTHREAFRHQETIHLVMVDIICTAMIMYGLVLLEQGVWAAARYIVEVKTSPKTEVTILRLLSALCDAVVTLGSDLRIVSKAPKLANLVQQGNSANALKGCSFLDLLAETDCVRFRQFLAREPVWMDSFNEPEPAQALNVHLRDRSGVGKQVQLFHSHFQDHNDQVGHLIGICEVDTGGFRVEGGDREGGAPEAAGDNTRPKRAAHGDESTPQEDSVSTRQGIADLDSDPIPSFPSSVSGGWAHGLQQPEVALAFDSLRFQIYQYQSKTPVLDVSFLEGENLQQWVTGWDSCRAMMQDLVNAALRPVTAASWPARGGVPSSLSFHVAFEGACPLPADVLYRGEAAAPGRAPAAGAGSGGGPLAPPTRLTVRQLKLQARRVANTSSRSRSSSERTSSRRHARAQPSLIGSSRVQRLQQAAEMLAEAPARDTRARL